MYNNYGVVMKYLYKSIDDYSNSTYQDFLYTLPSSFQRKIDNLIRTDDRYQRILGRMLLRELLNDIYDESKIYYDINGKPLIDGTNFNISHSHKYVLVAVDENKIGVDIEKNRKVNLNIMKKFLTKDEIHNVINSDDKYLSFWIYYTMKEAYIKYLGTGITDIMNVKFKFDRNKYICLNDKSLKIFVSTEIDDYIFAIVYK